MKSPFDRRLAKLETRSSEQERFADVAARLMRFEIERRILRWEFVNDGNEEARRAWALIQKRPDFAEADAAVRRGERLYAEPTIGTLKEARNASVRD